MSTQKNTTAQNKKKIPSSEKYILGIDIGSLYLRASIVGNGVLKDIFEVESDGVSYGVITDQNLFEKSLEKLLVQITSCYKNFPKSVIVGTGAMSVNSITGQSTVFTSRADGVITSLDIKKTVEVAQEKVPEIKNKSLLHTIPIKVFVDGKEIVGSLEGARGNKIESKILFIYDDIKQYNCILETFKEFKIDVDAIVAGPLADSIATLSKRERKIGVASVNVGYSTTSICVYENDTPLLCSVVKSGGENITSDIALGARTDIQTAERIKCSEPGIEFSKRRVDEIIEARVYDFSEKINQELQRIKRAELLPAGIVLSGGTSLLMKIEYMFRYNLKLPIVNGLKNLREQNNFFIDDPRFARSYGLTFFAHNISESSIYIDAIKNTWLIFVEFIKKILP